MDTLRLLAQPELTENRTARGTDTQEIENKHIQTGRRGEDGHRGGEDVAVLGLRLAECGTNGAGSPSTSRPCGPTFAQINPEGQTQRRRAGQAEWRVAPCGTTFAHR